MRDAEMVVTAGANAMGLIFADSPRAVSREMAVHLARLTNDQLTRVAVFRDRRDEEILAIVDQVDVEAVQLHDAMSGELETELRARGQSIIKALAITGDDFINFDERRVDAVLIDGTRAGSGKTHTWDRLAHRDFSVPIVAAGGLTPANVASVIETIRPWGVDSASGVELRSGEKDMERVSNFVANARRAFDETRE